MPKHLKATGYKGAKVLGSGEGYRYPHDSEEGIVRQEYLGVDKVYYHPTTRGAEGRMSKELERLRKLTRPEHKE